MIYTKILRYIVGYTIIRNHY